MGAEWCGGVRKRGWRRRMREQEPRRRRWRKRIGRVGGGARSLGKSRRRQGIGEVKERPLGEVNISSDSC